jgi:hypothetical protein
MQITPHSGSKFTDSTTYKSFNFYTQKIKIQTTCNYRCYFHNKRRPFADSKTVLTTRYLNNLKIFNTQYSIRNRLQRHNIQLFDC